MQREVDGAEAIDTIASFGMYCMENPFKMMDSVKEPSKRSWHDEDGDDEYIPNDGLRLSSYESDVKFGFKGDEFGANEKLRAFLDYLSKGMMKMYCEYNRIGRQHVRLKSVKQDLYRDEVDGDLLILTVTFKINDPATDIKPIIKGSDGTVTQLG